MSPGSSAHVDAAFLAGSGEMGTRMRALDWTATPLGSTSSWPLPLRTAVAIMLASRQPMFIWWGASLTTLYNDACRPLLGDKHPEALGQPASQVWHEVWHGGRPRG